jgi:hypothetical protein
MLMRLYFLLPDANLARKVVDELSDNNVPLSRLYAHSRNPSQLKNLPRASQRQRSDYLRLIEFVLWRTDLLVFGLALVIFIAALLKGWYIWILVSLLMMGFTFFAGQFFAAHIPNVHLQEFSDALSHNEVLLMVDVEADQVAQIESLIGQHHPAAVAGGSSWTLSLSGI